MKTSFIVTLIATATLVFAGSSEAGGKRHGHGGYGHKPQHHKHHRHRSDGGDIVKVAAGALVLGTLVYAISQSSRQSHAPAEPDYWYRIDDDGRCVLVQLNRDGREVWTYVEPGYCR